MRGLGVVVSLTLCLLATSCDEAKPSQQEPGSPEGIKVLADMERSVEEVNVCEAIRDAGAEGDDGVEGSAERRARPRQVPTACPGGAGG